MPSEPRTPDHDKPSCSTAAMTSATAHEPFRTTTTACSTPRTCRSRRSPASVGTPFYCYSTATLTRHYKVFAEAFAGMEHLVCYAVKANSNQAVLATLAEAGRGRRRGLGRRVAARARGRRARRTRSSSPASARRRGRWQLALEAGHRLLQCRIRAGTRAAVEHRDAARADARRVAAHQSRCRRQHPRQDHDRHGGEQVRHSLAAARGGLRAAAALPGIEVAGVDMHIGSQITELRAVRRRLPADGANWSARCAADGHDIRHVDLGGGLGVPYRAPTTTPPPHPTTMRRWSSSTHRARLGSSCASSRGG